MSVSVSKRNALSQCSALAADQHTTACMAALYTRLVSWRHTLRSGIPTFLGPSSTIRKIHVADARTPAVCLHSNSCSNACAAERDRGAMYAVRNAASSQVLSQLLASQASSCRTDSSYDCKSGRCHSFTSRDSDPQSRQKSPLARAYQPCNTRVTKHPGSRWFSDGSYHGGLDHSASFGPQDQWGGTRSFHKPSKYLLLSACQWRIESHLMN